MRIFDFSVGKEFQDARLAGVTIAPLTQPLASGAPFQAAVFRVAAGGGIARHPAVVPQLLVVFDGRARVSGGDGSEREVRAGEAAFWEAGEEHETSTVDGLTALILEGEGLAPYSSAAATT